MPDEDRRQPPNQPPRHRLRKLVVWFVGLLVCLVGVGTVARSRQRAGGLPGDRRARRWIHQRSWARMDRADGIAHFGAIKPVLSMDMLLLLLLLAQKRTATGRFFGLAVGGASALYLLTKPLVDRDRPALLQRLKPPRKSSFPSGHATVDMAFLVAVSHLLERSRWRWLVRLLGVPWVAVIGLCRVVEDEHYPSDVISGWLASWLWTRAVKQLYGLQPPVEP